MTSRRARIAVLASQIRRPVVSGSAGRTAMTLLTGSGRSVKPSFKAAGTSAFTGPLQALDRAARGALVDADLVEPGAVAQSAEAVELAEVVELPEVVDRPLRSVVPTTRPVPRSM